MIADYFNTLSLPGCAVSIDGVYLENEIVGYRTSSVSGRESMSIELNEQAMGETALPKYLSYKEKTRDITVRYGLTKDTKYDLEKGLNELRSMLQGENKKLIFNDEIDVYFIGTVSDFSSGIVSSGGSPFFTAVGEIVFHCTDPHKYSVVEKSFTASTNADGELEITIQNSGTESVSIDFSVEHHYENGYIGLVSEGGVLQLGKVEEADGETYSNSERITDSNHYKRWSGDALWVDDKGVDGENNAKTTQGTFTLYSVGGYDMLGLNTAGLSTAGHWNGALKTLTLPNPSVNVYAYMNSWFETGLMGQTGAQTFAFLDENDKLVCAQSINKGDMSGNTAYVDYWTGGNSRVLRKQVAFEPCWLDYRNPYTNAHGHSDMRKEGSKITFYWFGTYPSFVVPELKDVKVAKVQLWIGQYGNRGITNRFVTRNYFRRVLVQSDVEHYRDIPNRFKPNDTIFVDGLNTKTYVNGLAHPGDEVKGSTYFKAPPGESKVQVCFSSFCTTAPTVTAKIREAWL